MDSFSAVSMLDTFFHNVGRKFMLRQGQDFATDSIDYLGFVLLKLKKAFLKIVIHILDFFKKITMYYSTCFVVFGCTKDIVCKHLSRIRVVSLSHCFQLYNTMITLILTLHTNTWVCRLV